MREGLERPVRAEAGFQRLETHALDLFERLHDHLAVDFPGRRDTEAAIADHGRGDAVPGRDGEHAIPQDLCVVVGVDVNEARRHDAALGINGSRCVTIGLAHGNDLAVLDAEVAHEARLARAVDDGSAGDFKVVSHGCLS